MAKAEHPNGFTCECGKFHEFGMYVAAHWNESLKHTCDDCQREHIVLRGYVTLVKRRKAKKAEKP